MYTSSALEKKICENDNELQSKLYPIGFISNIHVQHKRIFMGSDLELTLSGPGGGGIFAPPLDFSLY